MKTRWSKSVSLLLYLLLWQGSAVAANLTGYAKSFVVAQDNIGNPVFTLPVTYQSQNSIRLMWEDFGERSVVQIHYELSPVFVSRALPVDSPTINVVSGSYRLTDIEQSLSEADEKTQLYQNLDRFNMQWQFDHGDFTIGRQAISFGSARIINPTDVFLPFDVRTFNTEYRTGVDAIRYQKPIGELGELDIGVVLGDNADIDNSAAFVQIRQNVNGKDLQFAFIEYARQTLVGAGIQTSISDLGFWLELANVSGDEDYIRLSTGVDYAFTENTFGQIEYHFNGAGSNDPDDYLALFNTIPYQKGGVFLLGRDYLIPSLSVQLSPLWGLGMQAIINLSDNSAFMSASAEYNIGENFYMDFGYYHFEGDDLAITPIGLPKFRSEYGTSPDVIYASLRFYF